MAEELHGALLKTEADKNVRVVLVKGAGKRSARASTSTNWPEKPPWNTGPGSNSWSARLLTISRMKKPVIAQVHGVAAANGMGLVAAADLAIAADDVRMGLTAINVGLNCVGPVVPVARSVGRKKALELLLYGNLISAAEALSFGLINRVVPKADLETGNAPLGALSGAEKSHCGPDRQERVLQFGGHGVLPAVRLYERGLRPSLHHRGCQGRRAGVFRKTTAGLERKIADVDRDASHVEPSRPTVKKRSGENVFPGRVVLSSLTHPSTPPYPRETKKSLFNRTATAVIIPCSKQLSSITTAFWPTT